MEIVKNNIYFSYILLGSMYFISKVFGYVLSVVCLTGLLLGLITAVITIMIGFASFKEYNRKISQSVAHWLAFIGPIIIIIIYTPLHMMMRLGISVFQFSSGKLIILIIFECLAITQIILAVLMFRNLILKGGDKK